MKISELIPGAYYSYQRDRQHCREGIFLAVRDEGGLYLADTYWDAAGTTAAFGWRITPEELATAVLLFDPADGWEPADERLGLNDFDDNDVRTVTSQHGLQKVRWIRTGSGPSTAKMLENAHNRTVDAIEKRDSAIRAYEQAVLDEQRLFEEINAGPLARLSRH